MSRHYSTVPLKAASEIMGFPLLKAEERLIEAGEPPQITVAHGYDRPLQFYFCDIASDDRERFPDVGIYRGAFGTTKHLSKDEYAQAMEKLGLAEAANAVWMDIQY